MAEDLAEAEHMQRADRRVERIGNALADRGRGLAPGDRRRIGTDQAIVLLQHRRAGDAELHARHVARRDDGAAALAHGHDPRIDHDVEQRLEARRRDLRIDLGGPGLGRRQVREPLIGSAEIGQIDQVDGAGEGREVRQAVLGALDRARLDGLGERAAGPKLPARCEAHVDLAVGHVLDVLFEIQLHDRIAARRAEHIGRGQGHDMVGCGLSLALLGAGLCDGGVRPEHPCPAGDHGSREAAVPASLRKFRRSAEASSFWSVMWSPP